MTQPIEFLERYWNHTSFRPMQEDIINAVLNNEDTFALLPTGGGKSVCFQIPALMKDGICIVISPLIALMKDQVANLNNKGIKALAITSGISFSELDTLLDNCIYGNYKFLYLSPERLQQDLVKDRIQQMNINLIAVDEAHCISQWGNDFRPAYKNIHQLRELHPSVNVIALTATAKPKVVDDIMSELDFIAPKIFKQSFVRPNIAFQVLETDDKSYKTEQILKKHHGSSIIYVRTRRATIEVQAYLESKGFKSQFFHGGLSTNEKQERLDLWTSNQAPIMVATSAFGMGIDKADVKTIIHFNLPESLESYYQEAGRAGRNGEQSFAVILKGKTDEDTLKNQFLNVLPSIDMLKHVYRKLCNYFQVSYGEGESTVHQFDLNEFCKTYDFNPTVTYNALQILDRNSIVTLSQQFQYQAKLQFVVDNPSLFAYLETHKHLDILVKSILRTYGGIFENALKIDCNLIARKADLDDKAVIDGLQQLHKDRIVDFLFSNTDSELTFLVPREDDKTINRISKHVEQQFNIKKEQIKSVIAFVLNSDICKNKQLLNYFGETIPTDCGMCSVCQSKSKKKNPTDAKSIMREIILLLESEPLSSRVLIERLAIEDQTVLKTLQDMVENNILGLTSNNKYKIKHT